MYVRQEVGDEKPVFRSEFRRFSGRRCLLLFLRYSSKSEAYFFNAICAQLFDYLAFMIGELLHPYRGTHVEQKFTVGETYGEKVSSYLMIEEVIPVLFDAGKPDTALEPETFQERVKNSASLFH